MMNDDDDDDDDDHGDDDDDTQPLDTFGTQKFHTENALTQKRFTEEFV